MERSFSNFTAIGAIVSSVIQLIVGLFTAFIQLITGDFTGALQTLQTTFWNVLNTIWTAVQSIFTQISEFIFASLNSILGTSISSWSQIFHLLTNFKSNFLKCCSVVRSSSTNNSFKNGSSAWIYHFKWQPMGIFHS